MGKKAKKADEPLAESNLPSDILDEYGVRLNILGKKDLLPPAVQQAARAAEEMTRHNDR
jgi:ditrans,polycis-polyprenyl diphosphate synthase